jgi:hypothetical protein
MPKMFIQATTHHQIRWPAPRTNLSGIESAVSQSASVTDLKNKSSGPKLIAKPPHGEKTAKARAG